MNELGSMGILIHPVAALVLLALAGVAQGGGYFYPGPPFAFYVDDYQPSNQQSQLSLLRPYGRQRHLALQHQLQWPGLYAPSYGYYDSTGGSLYYSDPAPTWYRYARKKNKGQKKGGYGGGHGKEHEGGWWYIRDPHKGCISGTWGHAPPQGLEKEHYLKGACGSLGHQSVAGYKNIYPQVPKKYQGPGGAGGAYGGGNQGGGYGNGQGSGYQLNLKLG